MLLCIDRFTEKMEDWGGVVFDAVTGLPLCIPFTTSLDQASTLLCRSSLYFKAWQPASEALCTAHPSLLFLVLAPSTKQSSKQRRKDEYRWQGRLLVEAPMRTPRLRAEPGSHHDSGVGKNPTGSAPRVIALSLMGDRPFPS